MKTNLIFIGIMAVIAIVAIIFYNDQYSLYEIGIGIGGISGIFYGYIKGQEATEERKSKEEAQIAFEKKTGMTIEEFQKI